MGGIIEPEGGSFDVWPEPTVTQTGVGRYTVGGSPNGQGRKREANERARARVGGGHGGGGGHHGGGGGGRRGYWPVVLPLGFGGVWDGYATGPSYDYPDQTQVTNIYLPYGQADDPVSRAHAGARVGAAGDTDPEWIQSNQDMFGTPSDPWDQDPSLLSGPPPGWTDNGDGTCTFTGGYSPSPSNVWQDSMRSQVPMTYSQAWSAYLDYESPTTTGARVGDLGTHASLPIGPEDRGIAVHNEWAELAQAVDNCPSGALTPTQEANFTLDYEEWIKFYNGGEGPGWTTLTTVNMWYGKALAWKAIIAKACGASSVPVTAPESAPIFSEHGMLGGVGTAVNTLVWLGAIGLGLWIFWPAIVGGRHAAALRMGVGA
jgi:hypothetical protein